jgi:Ca2+-binding EF-hand superfamily protein
VVETYLAVNTVSQEDRRALADKFQEIDKDNSGVIEYDELLECFRHVYGSTYSE